MLQEFVPQVLKQVLNLPCLCCFSYLFFACDGKRCLSAEKDNFDHGMVWEAPVHGSKYTTVKVRWHNTTIFERYQKKVLQIKVIWPIDVTAFNAVTSQHLTPWHYNIWHSQNHNRPNIGEYLKWQSLLLGTLMSQSHAHTLTLPLQGCAHTVPFHNHSMFNFRHSQ